MPYPTPARVALTFRASLLHEKRQMPREVPSNTDRVVKWWCLWCWVRELRLAISAVTTTGYKQGFHGAIYHTGLEPDKDAPCAAKQDPLDLKISFSAPKQTVYCTPISSSDVTFDILVLASPIHIPDSQRSIPSPNTTEPPPSRTSNTHR